MFETPKKPGAAVWKSPKVKYNELGQVSDSYVVHARGFSIEGDIWLDKWSVHSDHWQYYNEVVRHEYNWPERTESDWNEYINKHTEEYLYWSITGSGTILVQHPAYEKFNDANIRELYRLIDALDVPDDVKVGIGTRHDTRLSSVEVKDLFEPEDL